MSWAGRSPGGLELAGGQLAKRVVEERLVHAVPLGVEVLQRVLDGADDGLVPEHIT